jgi:hypothetical protein
VVSFMQEHGTTSPTDTPPSKEWTVEPGFLTFQGGIVFSLIMFVSGGFALGAFLAYLMPSLVWAAVGFSAFMTMVVVFYLDRKGL